MNNLVRKVIVTSLIAASSVGLSFAYANNGTSINTNMNLEGLNPSVYKTALRAYNDALKTGKVHNKDILTVIDFSLPSNQQRLWVINLKEHEVILKLYVAQGKNSGLKYATHFSNQHGSDASSLGIYVTGDKYYGHHGLSEHVVGIEKGVNDNAASRAIEIHPAAYVSQQFINEHGRAGRSWGCFAVSPKYSKQLINDVDGGSVIFAYAPVEHGKNFNSDLG